ncbi:MAG: class F sortase [Jatrophihabitantaceae bacterium]
MTPSPAGTEDEMSSDEAPTPARRSTKSRWVPALGALAAIVVLVGLALIWRSSSHSGAHHATVAQSGSRNVGTIPTASGSPSTFVVPNMIEIPKLSAKAPIVGVSTLPSGALDVPVNPRTVGWWNGGAKPGATEGTAILDGHVNFKGVDGVLGRIGTLNPGDVVYVGGLRNGKQTRLTFTITGVRTYYKTQLPYRQIFDQKSVGRLAIVTCGGPFDARTGNYRDNIVAFAVPA